MFETNKIVTTSTAKKSYKCALFKKIEKGHECTNLTYKKSSNPELYTSK